MKRLLILGATRGLGALALKAFPEWKVETRQYDFRNPNKIQGEELLDFDGVLHCTGGGMGFRGPYIPAQSMYELFMLNLGLAMEVNRYAAMGMADKGWGRIVHVGSIAGGEAIGSVGYNTMKAALGAYIRSMGRELAPFGVVVAGIAPGAFLAPGGAMERLKTNHPEAYQEFIESRLPRKKMGEGEELIPILKLLFSEGASMMGGSMIPVDAGEGRYYT